MTYNELIRLFKYDRWANTRTRAALISAPSLLETGEQVGRLFSHLIAAQAIWLTRVQGTYSSDLELWPEFPVDTWQERLERLHEAWVELLNQRKMPATEPVSYRNSKGNRFETSLQDIAQHVIIHGQHHRAQIAKHIRQHGQTPPATDFIFYTREHR